MNRRYWLLSICVGVFIFLPLQNALPQTLSEQVNEFLRNRIEAAGTPPQIAARQEVIHASVMLPIFYERRAYRPAWSEDDGPLSQARELVNAISEAYLEGLRPGDYHLNKIATILSEVNENQRNQHPLSPRRLVDLDLLLTDAFLIYGSHLFSGKINPVTIDSEWFANRREVDLAEILQHALNCGQVAAALKSLLPPQPEYAGLRESLKQYREIATNGGWPWIPDGPKLQKGMQDDRVVDLRNRLKSTGDLVSESENEALFDEDVELAVRKFQKRYGLDVDGVVAAATLAALNISVEERISQIETNLERWRWLPQDLGRRYILINIANFELDVVKDGQVVMGMRIIVGRDYRRTPVFSDKMTYLVFCPSWHVPHNIAVQDILPSIRKDPAYLTKQKMKIFEGWGNGATEIDPSIIDWSQVSAENFKYRFRQDPGPNNALGRAKFMFPNKFNVYLHDTPSRDLFAKSTRTFSSGCIRIENPVELAEYVLRGSPRGGRDNILTAINNWQEQTVRLPEPISIHLLYWTAWTNEDKTVQFRQDIYGRDKPLYEALREDPQSLTLLKQNNQ